MSIGSPVGTRVSRLTQDGWSRGMDDTHLLLQLIQPVLLPKLQLPSGVITNTFKPRQEQVGCLAGAQEHS